MQPPEEPAEIGGVEIREAEPADLVPIREIYNAVIEHSLAVWSEQAVDDAERRTWFAAKRAAEEPVLVAVARGEILGFATYGRFRNHSGYDATAEHTLHVREGARDAGTGSALLEAIIDRARGAGKHVIVAGVGAQNEGSLRFHHRHGFTEVGRMPGVGSKFGRRLDLVLLQRELG